MTKNSFEPEIREAAPDKLYQSILWSMVFLAFALILFFIVGQFVIRQPSFYDPYCEEYTGLWTYTDSQGLTQTLELPYNLEVEDGQDIRVSTVLPDQIPDGYYLFYKTGKNLRAEIDGEQRENYTIGTSVLGVTVKSMWVPIRLLPSDAGKTLTLIRPDMSRGVLVVSPGYYGNLYGFFQMLMTDNMMILLLAFAILVFDLIGMILCIIYRILSRRSFALMYLSIAVYVSALWLLFDNLAYPFLFDNYYIDGVMEFLIVMLLPYPYMAYLNILQKRRYQKVYNIAGLELLVEFLTFSTLQFTGILDFNSALPVINLNTGGMIILTIGMILYDLIVRKNRDYIIGATAFLSFVAMGAAEVLHVSIPGHTNDGFYIAIGLLFLLALSTYQEIVRIQRLHRETLEARASNAAKSIFLANMSHEIRTPINAILGMNELILREDVNDAVREYAGNVRDAGNSLLDIINDILDFSKVEQGKLELMPEEYDIGELLKGVITMIRIKASEKNLKLITDIDKDIPRKLQGDPKRIREILINLLNNAVKYTNTGSITLTVTMDRDSNSTLLTISVKDTGIGIREEDRDKLFKQFERLDYNKNRNVEGTGLGLAITANLIRLMSGSITCNSEYGKGTEFIAVIPQEVLDDTPVGNINELASATAPEQNPLDLFTCPEAQLLVVDDNIINQKVAVHLLQIPGAQVESCSSGAEMLERICEKKYDIIFLDHMMPEMDGLETLAKSRELTRDRNRTTPYIALTANAIKGAKDYYLSKGFTDYLSKPMSTSGLADCLLQYLPAEKIQKK